MIPTAAHQPARGTAAAPDLAADLAAIPAPWHPLPHEPLAGQADRRGPRAGRMPGRGPRAGRMPGLEARVPLT